MTPTERLSLLADKLEQNANNPKGMKFNLYDWFQVDEEDLEPIKPAIDCGTVGCAIGLATLIPEFNAEGFKYDNNFSPVFNTAETARFSWDAVRTYFGLVDTQAMQLFDSANYPIKKGAEAELMVAARIRKFLKTGEVP